MREILFCGKRNDNGEWIIGDLSQHKTGKKFIKCGDARSSFQVDENTICQFTGLLDKNGNKIWENDIIRHYNVRWEPEKYYIGIVRWNGVECRLENVVKDKAYTMNQVCKYEVIGNVFDNKELLEE